MHMFMNIVFSALGPLLFVAILVLAFLILRGLVLWYWRVNESLHFLEWQKNLLEISTKQNDRIIALLEKLTTENGPLPSPEPEEE